MITYPSSLQENLASFNLFLFFPKLPYRTYHALKWHHYSEEDIKLNKFMAIEMFSNLFSMFIYLFSFFMLSNYWPSFVYPCRSTLKSVTIPYGNNSLSLSEQKKRKLIIIYPILNSKAAVCGVLVIMNPLLL